MNQSNGTKLSERTASLLVLQYLCLIGAALAGCSTSGVVGNGPVGEVESDGITLAAPGRIEGMTEAIEIGAAVEGVLTEVRVSEGQLVEPGQVLARIECQDVGAELESARHTAEAARQALVRLRRGSRNEERRLAADELESARAVMKQAELEYRRTAGLYANGDISMASMERAERDLEVARAGVQARGNQLDLIIAPPLTEDLAKAEAEVKAAEGGINVLLARLEKCVIRSPIRGTVLRRHLNPGETVSSLNPQPIFSLADISRLRVRAEVDERDVGRIFIGQRVSVMSDALPGRELAGIVSSIGILMGRKNIHTGDPREKGDRDVQEVVADLEQHQEDYYVGLRVTVRFMVSRAAQNVQTPQNERAREDK